jgi:enoyl-CoA hydratase/carnithine racemase
MSPLALGHGTVLEELDAGVLTLTLHRPDRLNAFNHELHSDLVAALLRADADDAVRVIIVTGSGRAFCAGADLGAGGEAFRRDVSEEDYRDEGGLVSLTIDRLDKPVIAAINGSAVGVGITMTLPMDIRLAASGAKIGFVFTRRGIVPEACSTFFLPRLVGMARAMEWVLTGRVFSAEEALAGGLVSRVVPREQLLQAARDLAREIVDHTSPVAVAMSRRMLRSQFGASTPERAHLAESKGIYTRGRSADVREGVQAFLEKRRAEFPDRVSRDLPEGFPWT